MFAGWLKTYDQGFEGTHNEYHVSSQMAPPALLASNTLRRELGRVLRRGHESNGDTRQQTHVL